VRVDAQSFHAQFSPDGRWLAVTTLLDTLVLNTDSGEEHDRIRPTRIPSDGFLRAAFSPDGQTMAVSCVSGDVYLRDVQNRRPAGHWRVTVTESPDDWTCCVGFSPDGQHLATCSYDSMIRVWDVATGKCELTFRPAPEGAMTAVFSPDGQSLATCGGGGTVAIRNPSDGRPKAILVGHDPKSIVYTCCYTADGSRLLTCSTDGTVRLWETVGGQEVLTLRPFADLELAGLYTAAISSDGRRIAVNAGNGLVRVIDVPSPEPVPDLDPGELVHSLFVRFESRADVLTRLRTDPTLTEEVRQAALKLAEKLPATEKPVRPRVPDAIPRLRD
jgi:WD40 repeat protein